MDGVLRVAAQRPTGRPPTGVSILVLMDGVLRERHGRTAGGRMQVSILVLMDGVLRAGGLWERFFIFILFQSLF